ncbi:MAG: hypothetical protein SNJ74_11535 [Fimbriimonadaceae bacterium]
MARLVGDSAGLDRAQPSLGGGFPAALGGIAVAADLSARRTKPMAREFER